MSKDLHNIKDIHELDQPLQYKLSLKLGGRTPLGFYRYYFNNLEYHRTQTDCFNHVNELYHQLFGEYRYESYKSFRRTYDRKYKEILKF